MLLPVSTPVQWLVDLETSYTMKTGLTISVGAQNLFDSFPDRTKYPDPGSFRHEVSGVFALWIQRWILLPEGIVCILTTRRLFFF